MSVIIKDGVIKPQAYQPTTPIDTEEFQAVFNGLNDADLFTLAYNHATRKLSVTYGIGAKVYVAGKVFNKNGTEEAVEHDTSEGKVYFSYDSTGELKTSRSMWNVATTAQLAIVYYSPSEADTILFSERHPGGSASMSAATHKNLHETVGTRVITGLTVGEYVVPSNNVLANIQYSVGGGEIADEDLHHTITPLPKGNSIRVMHRIGQSWTHQMSTVGFLHDGTNIYANEFVNGQWALQPITANNRYVNYYLVAIPHIDPTKRICAVMGQIVYTSLTAAQLEEPNIGISNWADLTGEHVFFSRLTYQRKAASNTFNAELVGVQAIRSNNAVLAGTSPSNHQSLSGRASEGSHPASAISVETIAGVTGTNVQTVLAELAARIAALELP